MAQYQHLPIYKQTYDILLRTMSATKDFPREYKYTLGQKIKNELIELVVMIYRANSATDKTRHIESIRGAGAGVCPVRRSRDYKAGGNHKSDYHY
jgi:hypothetical protein